MDLKLGRKGKEKKKTKVRSSVSVTFKLVEPAADAIEGGAAGDVVDNEGADSAAVVGGGDGAESLLAGGVPNLSLDFLGVDFQALSLELDAYGGLGVHVELVPGVAGEKVGFAHRRVSDYDDLEEVLFSSLVLRSRHFHTTKRERERERERKV